MARNIKARPPWQGSRAGLYWHLRDSGEQSEHGPSGGSRSPLLRARQRRGGEPAALRGSDVSAAGSPLTRRSGWACPRARALRTISCGQPAGNLISAVAFGEKSGRRPRPASGEQTKVCEARPRGRALLMFNRDRRSCASPPGSAPGGADQRPPVPAKAAQRPV